MRETDVGEGALRDLTLEGLVRVHARRNESVAANLRPVLDPVCLERPHTETAVDAVSAAESRAVRESAKTRARDAEIARESAPVACEP
ncbi:hypothetical protein [Nocardia sp. JMUB6875]|uniref:hypothetical protein n=1 Tax=Nocardia sp. JMUB6875 TaxID=3158170 RepID=UPI0034E8BF25